MDNDIKTFLYDILQSINETNMIFINHKFHINQWLKNIMWERNDYICFQIYN